jgi:hypothetical protein
MAESPEIGWRFPSEQGGGFLRKRATKPAEYAAEIQTRHDEASFFHRTHPSSWGVSGAESALQSHVGKKLSISKGDTHEQEVAFGSVCHFFFTFL